MSTLLTTPPSLEPVSRDEAKIHIRVWDTNEDVLIASLIQAAREHVENMTARALIKQTWSLSIDRFPDAGYGPVIEMPYPPLLSVQSISYIDPDGIVQTLDPASYVVDNASTPGRITPAYGTQWPATRRQINAVTISYDAGYGTFSTNVPAPIRSAILLLIGHLYENREAAVEAELKAIPMGIERLLGPYRMIGF